MDRESVELLIRDLLSCQRYSFLSVRNRSPNEENEYSTMITQLNMYRELLKKAKPREIPQSEIVPQPAQQPLQQPQPQPSQEQQATSGNIITAVIKEDLVARVYAAPAEVPATLQVESNPQTPAISASIQIESSAQPVEVIEANDGVALVNDDNIDPDDLFA